MQRGYRPEPWNAPRAARKPEASLRSVQARTGYAGGRPRAAPRCCSLAALEQFKNHVEHGCESRMALAIVTNLQPPCRMPRIRLGRQACGLDDVPACGGEAVEPN